MNFFQKYENIRYGIAVRKNYFRISYRSYKVALEFLINSKNKCLTGMILANNIKRHACLFCYCSACLYLVAFAECILPLPHYVCGLSCCYLHTYNCNSWTNYRIFLLLTSLH